MRGRHKRISAGTIVMTIAAAIVLFCAIWMILAIRNPNADLSMDAERLVSSIGELAAASRPQATAQTMPGLPRPTAAPQMYAAPTALAAQPSAVPQQPAAAQPTQSASDIRTLTLTVSGEIAFDSDVIAGTLNAAAGQYNLSETLSAIQHEARADAGIALMHRLPSMSAANGRAAEQAAAAIHDAGFQYVLLNSEKALETGENGAARMLSALQSAGVTPLGLRSAAGPSTAKTISIRGISIAVLAYTDTLSADSKKAVPDAAARERMVTVFDADQARQDIRAARESGADIVLVAMHWGGANDTAPTAAQRTAAQALCEAGADIIIGAHSNAVQPVEYLSSAQDTAHSTLVAWSMGTLLSASRANREVVSGMLLHLTLSYDMQRRALSIASVQYTPTYCWGQKTDALYKYRVLCSAEEAPNAMIQKQREIMGRALKLIQDAMAKGVAVQR